ncbi:mavicyanin-like [Herrania umbratica]|uniref:Mavicyanin-like n=1 Tax=Herrania umbratica TaxID=108875 RepID=A0A6J0ZY65_9ROSI|nr:mavicyanin-like [Herrania umbratica]
MAFGMNTAILLFTMALFGVSMGAVHQVGDFGGWNIVAPVDYQKWAATRNFHVGDIVVFKYKKLLHNVLRVTHQNFKSCNATFPIAVYSSGSDTIELTRPGHFFFICGLPGHCLSGQKLHIEVAHGQEYLQPFASGVNHLPQSGSEFDQALAPSPESIEPIPGPAQSSSPSLKLFNVWAALAVLACGLGVTGIVY